MFFCTKGIVTVFVSGCEIKKVKSGSLYFLINSWISSLILSCSLTFSIFKIFSSVKIELILKPVTLYSFPLLNKTSSISFSFEKSAVKELSWSMLFSLK